MLNFSLRSTITAIAIVILVHACAGFAQTAGLDSGDNRGFLDLKSLPEEKKDTIIFKKQPVSSERPSWQEEKNLTALQKQARIYRSQGLESQRVGNLDEAMGFYQKAIQLDPAYAVAYNDLGIVFEIKGFINRAEDSYLKAIKVDPNFLSAYTNLACVYENKRDLEKAAVYWRKRAELGQPGDAWTEKASKRLRDISLVLSERPLADAREQEVTQLLKETSLQKSILRKDDSALARMYFQKAKASYEKQDYAAAIKEALDALQLDPANSDIIKFIEKVEKRALSQ